MSTVKKALSVFSGILMLSALLMTSPAAANGYREQGKTVKVAKSNLHVTPPQDWNKLGRRPGKNAETWTLDGEQLNDVTFYGGIAPGKPLVKERNKKREPLPKMKKDALLIDVPELLEGTYRAYKQIGIFKLASTEPTEFLGLNGVKFTYEYVDADNLTRLGEARAAIVEGELYMVTFDAPRLHYFAKGLDAFHALVETAKLL
ncbi:hypothetical protein [Sphingopyxis sp. BSNA05]|uniref:hypothetical protein n=1 Tax=Sphingomonadales TaxID=204457 RepID=UPI001563B5F6